MPLAFTPYSNHTTQPPKPRPDDYPKTKPPTTRSETDDLTMHYYRMHKLYLYSSGSQLSSGEPMMDRVATGSTAEIKAPKRRGSIGLDVSIRANPCAIRSIEAAVTVSGMQYQPRVVSA